MIALPSVSQVSPSAQSENAALQQHAKFWDRKNKGYITPVDAIAGLMNLGYNIFFSVTIGAFLTIIFSYATQDSWLPDPLCRVNVKGIIKNSAHDEGVYDEDGHFNGDKFENVFSNYARADLSGNTITVKELVEMSKNDAQLAKDPFAWSNSALRWCTAYFFVGRKGIMNKDDVRSAYDGSLFFRLRDAQRPMIEQGDARRRDNTIVTLSGVQIPKSTIRSIESHISSFSTHIPHTFSETGILDWLKSSLKSLPSSTASYPSTILTGVPTPLPPRHSLFTKQRKDDEDYSVQLLSSGLTGIKAIHLDTQDLAGLTGVLGHEHKQDGDELPSNSDSLNSNTMDELAFYGLSGLQRDDKSVATPSNPSLPGLRSEEEGYRQDQPTTDWLRVSLTGVQRTPEERIVEEKEDGEGTAEIGKEENIQSLFPVSGVLNQDKGVDAEYALNGTNDKQNDGNTKESVGLEEHKQQKDLPDFGSEEMNYPEDGTTCSDDGSSPRSPMSLTMQDSEIAKTKAEVAISER